MSAAGRRGEVLKADQCAENRLVNGPKPRQPNGMPEVEFLAGAAHGLNYARLSFQRDLVEKGLQGAQIMFRRLSQSDAIHQFLESCIRMKVVEVRFSL